MSKDKFMLIYENVFNTDSCSFIIDNEEFFIIDSSGNINKDYVSGCELLKGLFVLFNKGRKACVVVSSKLDILHTCNVDDLGIWIAKKLDNLDYNTLKDIVEHHTTGLSVDFVNTAMTSSDYMRIMDYYMNISIKFEQSDANKNIEILKIVTGEKVLHCVFRNSIRETSFFEYSENGSEIQILSNRIKIVGTSDRELFRNSEKLYKLYNCNDYICDVVQANVLKDNKKDLLVDIKVHSENEDTRKMLRINGGQYEILASGYYSTTKNRDNILLHYYTGKNDVIEIYNTSMNKLYSSDARYEFLLKRNTVFSYIDNDKRVYIEVKKSNTIELCRVNSDIELHIGHIKSSDKLISSLVELTDSNKNILFTIVNNKSNMFKHKKMVYENMLEFWSKIVKIDNINGLEIYAAVFEGNDRYYVINNSGNIIDRNSYSSLNEIKAIYKNKKALKNVVFIK